MTKAEVISTGEELLSGSVVDTNSAWVSTQLRELGFSVTRHTTLPDDLEELCQGFQEASKRAELVVVTGGLGPTEDDLTSLAAAKAKGVEWELHPEAKAFLDEHFQRLGRTPTKRDLRQAMLPVGATPFFNPLGTAPGFFLDIGNALFFFFPGVPKELQAMWHLHLVPEVQRRFPHLASKKVKTYTFFGLAEAKLEEELSPFLSRFPFRFGFRALFPYVQLKVYYEKEKKDLEKLDSFVQEHLGLYLLAPSDTTFPREVFRLLKEREETLSLGESCTGGLLAHEMVSLPGCSEVFCFSAVTYSNDAKQRVLGVKSSSLSQGGAVSLSVALEMAKGARREGSTTYGLSTTGIAGPGGGSQKKPVGTVCIGLSTPFEEKAFRFYFAGREREMCRSFFAALAWMVLFCHLEKRDFPITPEEVHSL